MIFGAPLLERVLSGHKTQTRRRVKAFEEELGVCRYREGRTYAVQAGRGQTEIGRILITGLRREALGAISPEDARREGFSCVADFEATGGACTARSTRKHRCG